MKNDKRVGTIRIKVTGVPKGKGVEYTVNAKAKGHWSLGSLTAIKEYIAETIKIAEKETKNENRGK